MGLYPCLLLDTSLSDDVDTWSDMPFLQTVNNSDISASLSDYSEDEDRNYFDGDGDWFSEVRDDGLSDNVSAEADFKSAMADVNDEEEESCATMLTEIV
jgi:hypothetical protein